MRARHRLCEQPILLLGTAILASALLSVATPSQAQDGWAATSTDGFHEAGGVVQSMAAATMPIHIVVALKPRNKADLDGRVAAITRRGTRASNLAMSAAQVQATYSPTAQEAQRVADYLGHSGFTDVGISRNRMLISANGTSASVQKAFHTQLAYVKVGSSSGIANLSPVQVPSAFAKTVQSVLGLQTLSRSHVFLSPGHPVKSGDPHRQRTIVKCPNYQFCFCLQDCPPNNGFAGYSPSQIATFYNASNLPTAAATSVGIMAEGNLAGALSDFAAFLSEYGYASYTPNVVYVGTKSSDTSALEEWDLDSQAITGVAGGKLGTLTFYAAKSLSDSDLTQAYNEAVTSNSSKIINISFGECELSAQSDGAIAADDPIFEMAVAQGQTISAASGDSGSNICTGPNQTGMAYPATSPYVIAVGGTTLTISNSQYSSETAWLYSGGGPSVTEPQPAWQNGIVAGSARGIPDLAFDANPSSGVSIIYNGTTYGAVGGTSLSSPIFVGIMARFESASGNTMPFPAQWIYHFPIGKRATAFHDVTTGSNGGYSAGPGWDYTTGWGSINAANTTAALRTLSLIPVIANFLNN